MVLSVAYRRHFRCLSFSSLSQAWQLRSFCKLLSAAQVSVVLSFVNDVCRALHALTVLLC